jgi:hypothetical protein
MSYDLIFARLAPGQTWQDHVDVDRDLDEIEFADERPLDPAAWQRIVQRVREFLPEVVDEDCELGDENTAIQVLCTADEASVQVPYWHTGPMARHVVATMYRISAVIEEETGLSGFDPQIEQPIAEASLDDAVLAFEAVAQMFAENYA